ncbi:hypothetical protein SNEBB_003971 [Seison nebaliae]|nr:hypothetical protein SNEBB_003971 [Seison nebaliae]
MSNLRAFFHEWCAKNKYNMETNFERTGVDHAPSFNCTVNIELLNVTSCGIGSNKKQSMNNALMELAKELITRNILTVATEKERKLWDKLLQDYKSDKEKLVELLEKKKVDKRESSKMEETMGEMVYYGYNTKVSRSRLNEFTSVNNLECHHEIVAHNSGHETMHECNLKLDLTKYFEMNDIVEKETIIEIQTMKPSKIEALRLGALLILKKLVELNCLSQYKEHKKDGTNKKKPLIAISIIESLKIDEMELLRELDKLINLFNLSILNISSIIGNCVDSRPIPLLSSSQQYHSYEADSESKRLGYQNNGGTMFVKHICWTKPSMEWDPWRSKELNPNSININEIQIKERPLKYQEKLAIVDSRQQILEMIRENTVCIIKGVTGCGKTTQVPQFILDDFILNNDALSCNIIVTQPRRLSSIAIAERVSKERNESMGDSVGYMVRFEHQFPRPLGSILFCTTGALLKRLENGLLGVSHIIVDEVHERDVATDFLLIILKDLAIFYPEIRIILMSATIDIGMFKSYFNSCPSIEILTNDYEVKEYYLEDIVTELNLNEKQLKKLNSRSLIQQNLLTDNNLHRYSVKSNFISSHQLPSTIAKDVKETLKLIDESSINISLIELIVEYCYRLEKNKNSSMGAILIFLPTWYSIQTLLSYFIKRYCDSEKKFVFLPLHSQLSREDQSKVFNHYSDMKIIFSTNIAESSITIDDVIYVIDSCQIKRELYSTYNSLTTYEVDFSSKSNCRQRKGRCGRVANGICFFLLTRFRFESLDNFPKPEICRIPLAQIVLIIKLLRLPEPIKFLQKALQPPPVEAVQDAMNLLQDIHAIRYVNQFQSVLSTLGHILARLPISPVIGKFIVLCTMFNLGDAACAIGAAISYPDNFLLKVTRESNSCYDHRLTNHRYSDHIALLHLISSYETMKTYENEREFCKVNCLNRNSLRTVLHAKDQMLRVLKKAGFKDENIQRVEFNFSSEDDRLDLIVSFLAMTLRPQICVHSKRRKLHLSGGSSALIHKSSVNCNIVGEYPSKHFIFGHKIKTDTIQLQQLSMLSPIQLMVFGSIRVEYDSFRSSNSIFVDGWIELPIKVETAVKLVKLRDMVHNLLNDCCEKLICCESIDADGDFVHKRYHVQRMNHLICQMAEKEMNVIEMVDENRIQSIFEKEEENTTLSMVIDHFEKNPKEATDNLDNLNVCTNTTLSSTATSMDNGSKRQMEINKLSIEKNRNNHTNNENNDLDNCDNSKDEQSTDRLISEEEKMDDSKDQNLDDSKDETNVQNEIEKSNDDDIMEMMEENSKKSTQIKKEKSTMDVDEKTREVAKLLSNSMNLQSGKSRKRKKLNGSHSNTNIHSPNAKASCHLQFKRCVDGRPMNTNPIYPINPLLPQQQQQRLPANLSREVNRITSNTTRYPKEFEQVRYEHQYELQKQFFNYNHPLPSSANSYSTPTSYHPYQQQQQQFQSTSYPQQQQQPNRYYGEQPPRFVGNLMNYPQNQIQQQQQQRPIQQQVYQGVPVSHFPPTAPKQEYYSQYQQNTFTQPTGTIRSIIPTNQEQERQRLLANERNEVLGKKPREI